MSRRTLLRTGAMAASGSLWQGAAHASADAGPYGPLQRPGADGLALPEGFTGRVVARTGHKVAGLTWHAAPDGGACFPDGDGWIYVSNAAVQLLGGAAALRFTAGGDIRQAYRVLSGTNVNNAGGATPWRTWLSCEQVARGRVFECDPYGYRAARPRLAMGRFKHGAAACDPEHEAVYLTEDEPDGCLYRFRPRDWGDLTEGTLEVLTNAGLWKQVPYPAAPLKATRYQVPDARHFNGGGGCHYVGGVCYFSTGGDRRLWAYHVKESRLDVVHDARSPLGALHGGGVAAAGDLFVAADRGTLEINVVTPDRTVAPFLRLDGHSGSELTGLAFSPDGTRLYFSSHRGTTGARAGTDGHTFEVTGPFHH